MLCDAGEVVIKPTVDSDSGNGVRFLKMKNGIDAYTGECAQTIFAYYDGDFNVQECLHCHKVLTEIYSSSVNTFRVVTYIWNGKVCHMPIIMRVGQGGNRVDNAHAGGMFVSVSDDGILGKRAYTEFRQEYAFHPETNLVFDGYCIPQVPQIIEASYCLHRRMPQLKALSWDLTLGEDGSVVLIEVNTMGQAVWVCQMASGKPAFGENTAEVLRSLKKVK